MQITATLTLTPTEEAEIAAILGCNVAVLSNRLNDCAEASIKEYLAMFRGQKVFKQA